MDNQQKIKIDLVGNIGNKGGIGNYSTKLYHSIKNNTDQKVQINKVEPNLNFPLIQPLIEKFLIIPYIFYKSDADLIHFTDQEQVAGLFFVSQKRLENVIVTVHDISPYVNDYSGPLTKLISKFYCNTLTKISNIISISKFTKKELQENLELGDTNIQVIYQGIDQNYFCTKIDETLLEKYDIEEPYVTYVGSEIERKNIRENLKQFKNLKEEKNDLSLVKIGKAGRKKYRKKTLEHMRQLGLEKNKDVIFTGFVEENDLPFLYSMAEANLLFSHYEGFGRTALEAESCQTPTLTHNKPPMNEYLPEDRYMKISLDIDRTPAKIPSWEKTSEKTIQFYTQNV